MHPTQQSAVLKVLMEDQIQALDEFSAALAHEQTALKSRDSDALSASVERKLSRLSEVDQCGRALVGFLQQQGLRPDKSGMAACIDSPELESLWRSLRQRLEDCNHRNRVNGGIIQVSKASNDRLLDILRGNDRPSLYGAKGVMRRALNSESIAKA
jgi:flagella synthesis protein FlgN